MKFFTSDFWTYDGKPKPWCDYGLDEIDTYGKYFREHIKVWDTDTCGDEKVEIVFENGRAFILDYTWWFEYQEDPEFDWSGYVLCDDLQVEEVSLDEIKKCMKKYRSIIGTVHDARLRRYVV